MQTSQSVTPFHTASQRANLGLQDHPVFQALPPRAQAIAAEKSILIHLDSGETAPGSDCLHFVLAGVLGLSPGNDRVCVSAVVAGAVYGWDRALDPDAPLPVARALIDTLACQIPTACIVDSMGREWLTRLVARQSPRRLHFLAEEAVCNASHLVVERLAKWLVRLHCGANGAPLSLTQADIGAMLGVQRTSINAAAGRLQTEGLVRFGRGKVQILNLAGLRAVSCGCGEARPGQRTTLVKHKMEVPSWSSVAHGDAAGVQRTVAS
ncbi:MAG: Crp/Fnr family transcriptional regulator [Brevundimonas sp.]